MAEQIQNSTITPSAVLAAQIVSPATTGSVVSAANLPSSGTFSLVLKGTAADGSDDGIIAVGAITGTALSSITWVRNGQGTFPADTEVEYDLDARALIAYVAEQIATHSADTTGVHGIADTSVLLTTSHDGAATAHADAANLLHTTGDESKSDQLELTGTLAIAGPMNLTGVNVDAGTEQTLTLAAAVTSTTSTTWTVTQGSIDTLIALGLPLVARMAAGEQITIRSLNDTTNQITVVRGKFGTTKTTYSNGATFVTEMTSNYLVRSGGDALISIVSYTGPNIYLPPTSTVETNVTPPADGDLFLVSDAAGGAITIRIYGSGTAAEPGVLLTTVDRLLGAILFRYSAVAGQYSILTQNVLTQRIDLDTGGYVGYTESQGTGDPNGVAYGAVGDTYVDKTGGAGATGWMNIDGGTTWVNIA